MKRLLFLVGLVFLVSCEKNEFTIPAPAFPGGGGGSYSAPSRSTPQTPMAPPANHHPMIDNPDNPKETVLDEVYATDEGDAQRRCEEIARSRSDRLAIVRVRSVRKLTQQPYKNGSYKFECQLEIEYQ